MDFFLLENSNNYVVQKLRNEEGALQEGALLTIEIREYDRDLETSSQVLPPLDFVELGKGDYRVHLPPGLPLEPHKEYRAIVSGTADGRVLHEVRSVFARRRLSR